MSSSKGIVLGLIPARSGSKGVPHKNMRVVGDKTLIAHAAEVALGSKCDRVLLSTDSEEYAAEGRRTGLEVLEIRPSEIALDTTAMIEVIEHVVEGVEKEGHQVNSVVLLQPTSPFRRAQDVNACLDLLDTKQADSVVSVIEVPHQYNSWNQMREEDGQLDFVVNKNYTVTRRQDMPTCYIRNGAVYVFKRELLLEQPPTIFGRKCLKYVMSFEDAINIDQSQDLINAHAHWKKWSAYEAI